MFSVVIFYKKKENSHSRCCDFVIEHIVAWWSIARLEFENFLVETVNFSELLNSVTHQRWHYYDLSYTCYNRMAKTQGRKLQKAIFISTNQNNGAEGSCFAFHLSNKSCNIIFRLYFYIYLIYVKRPVVKAFLLNFRYKHVYSRNTSVGIIWILRISRNKSYVF